MPDVLGEVDTITREQIEEQDKAEREAAVVPEGSWEGTIHSWAKVDEADKGENNQFHGISQYRVGVRFYDCPEPGRTKMQFFNMTPLKMLGDGGRPKLAYVTLLQMVKSLEMEDRPIPDVMEQAKVDRLKYKVAQFLTAEGSTVNFLKAITKV